MVRFFKHLRQRFSRKMPAVGFGTKVSHLRYDWIQLRKTALNAQEDVKQAVLGRLDAIETDLTTLEEEKMGRISKRGDIFKRVEQGLNEIRPMLEGVSRKAPSIFRPIGRTKRKIYLMRDDWGILRMDAFGLSKEEAKPVLEKLDLVEDDLKALEKGVGRLQRGEIMRRVREGLKAVKEDMRGKRPEPRSVEPEARPAAAPAQPLPKPALKPAPAGDDEWKRLEEKYKKPETLAAPAPPVQPKPGLKKAEKKRKEV